jgi:dienelactone hydrolase
VTFAADWACTEVVDGDIRHRVHSGGHGPDLVLLHELVGIGDELVDLAEELRVAGYRVHVPELYPPGSTATSMVRARVCLWRELHLFATRRTSPLVGWLRALVASPPGSAPGGDVAVIGMCLTGGLVLGVLASPAVVAGVAAQPSLPFVVPVPGWSARARSSVGLAPADLQAAAEAGTPVLVTRYRRDRLSPPARTEAIIAALGDGACVDVPHPSLTVRACGAVTTVELPATGHSTLTSSEPSAALRDATRAAVLAFLGEHHPVP